jgi:hypothetical protein
MTDLFRFECPVCQYDSDEAGVPPKLVPEGEYLCPVCLEDNGREVVMRLRRADM